MLDLIGSKSERGDQFYDYLYENVCQGWRRRDLGIDTKSAQEVVEGLEKVNQGIIASTGFVDRLKKLYVREIMQMSSEEDRHTASRMPMPVNIAFAGGNGCRMSMRARKTDKWIRRTTRPIAWLTAELMVGEHNTSTEELRAFISFPPFSLNSRKLCACSWRISVIELTD